MRFQNCHGRKIGIVFLLEFPRAGNARRMRGGFVIASHRLAHPAHEFLEFRRMESKMFAIFSNSLPKILIFSSVDRRLLRTRTFHPSRVSDVRADNPNLLKQPTPYPSATGQAAVWNETSAPLQKKYAIEGIAPLPLQTDQQVSMIDVRIRDQK